MEEEQPIDVLLEEMAADEAIEEEFLMDDGDDYYFPVEEEKQSSSRGGNSSSGRLLGAIGLKKKRDRSSFLNIDRSIKTMSRSSSQPETIDQGSVIVAFQHRVGFQKKERVLLHSKSNKEKSVNRKWQWIQLQL